MDIKFWATSAVVTMAIGGSAYTFNSREVIDNLSQDTGMSQQESEQYVTALKEEDLVSWNEVGTGHIKSGQEFMKYSNEIDCVNFQYEWESPTLTCLDGKVHLYETGTDEVNLGNSLSKLATDSGSKTDMISTIGHIDEVNADYQHEIVKSLLGPIAVDENYKANSYNKALLTTALESE